MKSRDVVKLGTGLIATLTALVLGLLIASAKSSFDAQGSAFSRCQPIWSSSTVPWRSMDPRPRKPGRRHCGFLVAATIDRLWLPQTVRKLPGWTIEGSQSTEPLSSIEIRTLTPKKNDGQRGLQSQALQIGAELTRTRWLLNEETESSIPRPFLVVVVFWLAVIFTSFGLFAPPNPIVITSLLICALSVGGAMFLIVDLDQPFGGLIQISGNSLRNALSQLGQ